MIARVTQRRRTVCGTERSQANADIWSGGKSGVIEERLQAKLAGTLSWPDQKETPVKDLKLKDGDLKLSIERKIGDNKFTVEYKLKIDGDKLEGKGAAEFGGEKRAWDMKATTEKKGSSTLAAKSSDHERIRGSNCCGWFDGAAASSRGHQYANCSEDTNPITVDSCRAPCRRTQCLRR